MRLKLHVLLAAAAIATLLGGCEANGGPQPGVGGGGNGPDTDISDWTCTSRGVGSAQGATDGLLCQVVGAISVCEIADPQNVADGNADSFAIVDFPVAALGPVVVDVLGLNGTATITVDLGTTIPAGHVAAFDVTLPGMIVEAAILQDINVRSLVGEDVVEEINVGQALNLLGLLGDPDHHLLGFVNTQAYRPPSDRVQRDGRQRRCAR